MNHLKVIETNRGKGIIVTHDIPAETVILEFKGNTFDRESIVHELGQVLQIGNDRFLGPSGSVDDYINHSCAPNCGLHIVGPRAFLIAIHQIPAKTEITFDYSTTSNDTQEQWQMECKCGFHKCRKIISGYQYLDKETKERYEKMGIIPKYLIGK